ncbi:MAG: serine hydrolase [Pseudomonadota bacterium]
MFYLKYLRTKTQVGLIMLLSLISLPGSSNELVPLPEQREGIPWPTSTWPEAPLNPAIDQDAFNQAVDALFEARDERGTPDTRALLVIDHGRLVYERYAESFDRNSRFHSWSMAKSYTQALTGILVKQGKLELDAPAPVPEWQAADDPRKAITLRQMLNMTTGIDNGDGASSLFLGKALFGEGANDVNAYAAKRELVHEPGTHWGYSTATSTLVAGIVGRTVADNREGRRAFFEDNLLHRIGAKDTVFEYDGNGQFLGGSHVWATARDYARFGLFCLRNGVWEGKQVLPDGWIDFGRTAAPTENNGSHGAHFWVNEEPKGWQPEILPGGPRSAFTASGNGGQSVLMIPTHDLIIVRLGELNVMKWKALNEKLAAIFTTFPMPQSEEPTDAE